MMNGSKETSTNRFRKLFPDLTEEERRTAEDNFRRYVALALRVYETICADPDRYEKFRALTVARREATLETNSPQPNEPHLT